MRIVNGVMLQPDAWQNYSKLAQAVTPTDGLDLLDITRYVYIGVTGDLTVIMQDDASKTPILFKAVPAGTLLPIAVGVIQATGTTATQIVALF